MADRARLGALARTFLESKDDQFVSKDSLPRAARVLETIVRYATEQGMTVRDPRAVDAKKARNNEYTRGWSGHLEIEAGETTQRIQIREIAGRGGGKFDYNRGFLEMDREIYDRVQRLPRWQRNRGYWFVPTGRLELRVDRPGFGFDTASKKYPDTTTLSVEKRIGEVFRYIEVARRESVAVKQRAQEAADQKKRDWEAAMSRARTRFRASQEEALLLKQIDLWHRQSEVTAFLAKLGRRSDESDPLTAEWLAIGERVARRLDPFESLTDPEFAEPTASDLAPFLNGWSPYGPDRR
ncbi:hypothetical protein P9139_17965 [Curtobacterium flaccumfaciens]|nr:hypothetical protein P9139_17965 [Curtobacterium flaccumfaciens]